MTGIDIHRWSRGRRIALLALIGILVAGGPLGTDMYTPALPSVIDDLDTAVGLVQLTIMTYNVGLGVGQLVWGPISDRFGRRWPVIIGAAGFAAAALLASFASTIWLLLAGRLLMGFAGAAGIVVGRAIVRDLYSGNELAKVFGVLAIVFGIAPVLGPLIGSGMLAVGTWRSTFLLLMGIGIALAVAALIMLPETLRPENRVQGPSHERREAWIAPLKNAGFVTSVLILVGAASSMIFYLTSVSIVLQTERGLGVLEYAIIYALSALGVITGGQVGPWLARRVGGLRALVLALLVNLLGAIGVALSSALHWPLWLLVVSMFLTILAGGVCMPLALALAMAPFAKGAGTAAALAGGAQLTLGSIAPAIVVNSFTTSGVLLGVSQAAVTIGTLGMVAVAARVGKRRHRPEDFPEHPEPNLSEPA